MKKIVMIIALLTGVNMSFAQQAVTKTSQAPQKELSNEQKAERFAARWTKELGLTSIQKDQVYQAKLTQLAEVKALDDKYGTEGRKTNYDEYKAVQDKFTAAMQTALTPDQFTKWQSEKKGRNAGMKVAPQKVSK